MTSILITIKKNTQVKRKFCILVILSIVSILVQPACKKLVETPIPTDQVAENAVYNNDATAISVLTALYSAMNTAPFQGSDAFGSIALFTGLAADEYTLSPGVTYSTYVDFYQNALSQVNPSAATGEEHWALLYNFVFKCNAAIAGLNSATALSLPVKQQLMGEAKFMRAFMYFYLVNEFGDVPLALTTDPQTNTLLARLPQAKVYEQIIADLLEAEQQLSNDYLDVALLNITSERVRPTKWAAKALLARAYLYAGDFSKAEAKATEVINNNPLYDLLPSLNDVFLKNSREAIWQIQPTDIDFNTREGQTLIIPPTGPSVISTANPVYLSDHLLNSFEANDQRAVYGNWVDTTIYPITTTPLVLDTVVFPYKYKINTSPDVNTIDGLQEYFMVLRLAELYLIRAEARAQQNTIAAAQADLNAIRTRAGLGPTTANDQSSLLSAILHERQAELFTEWGHRWFDLKRTGNIEAVMSVVTPQKASGAPWQSYQQWFPLPIADLLISPNLTQNTGY